MSNTALNPYLVSSPVRCCGATHDVGRVVWLTETDAARSVAAGVLVPHPDPAQAGKPPAKASAGPVISAPKTADTPDQAALKALETKADAKTETKPDAKGKTKDAAKE